LKFFASRRRSRQKRRPSEQSERGHEMHGASMKSRAYQQGQLSRSDRSRTTTIEIRPVPGVTPLFNQLLQSRTSARKSRSGTASSPRLKRSGCRKLRRRPQGLNQARAHAEFLSVSDPRVQQQLRTCEQLSNIEVSPVAEARPPTTSKGIPAGTERIEIPSSQRCVPRPDSSPACFSATMVLGPPSAEHGRRPCGSPSGIRKGCGAPQNSYIPRALPSLKGSGRKIGRANDSGKAADKYFASEHCAAQPPSRPRNAMTSPERWRRFRTAQNLRCSPG